MTPEERIQFIEDVALAVNAAPSTLTDEERRWVRLAIKKEAQSFALRQAIIEKTLAGLVWFLCIGLGYLILEFLRNHGMKL